MAHRWSGINSPVPALPRRRGHFFFWAAASIAALLGGILSYPVVASPRESAMARRSIEEVIAAHTDELLAIDGVVVVFAGEDAERQPIITDRRREEHRRSRARDPANSGGLSGRHSGNRPAGSALITRPSRR